MLRGLDRTQSGVLVYVSLAKHYIRIVPAEAAAATISQEEWQVVVDKALRPLAAGAVETALTGLAEDCAALLSRRPPDGHWEPRCATASTWSEPPTISSPACWAPLPPPPDTPRWPKVGWGCVPALSPPHRALSRLLPPRGGGDSTSSRRPRFRRCAFPVLELALQQDQRVRGHVGVEQGAVAFVSFAAVEHQPVAHRRQRLAGAREKLREQNLRANVARLRVGALTPRNHLGPGEFIVEEVSFVLIGVGDDRRFCDEVLHLLEDRREARRVFEIAGPNAVDLDGVGVDRSIRVDPGAPGLALAPAPALAQHFDEADFDDDARRFPGKGLFANELGVGRPLARGLRVEGDQPVETVEEVGQIHHRRSRASPVPTPFAVRRHGRRLSRVLSVDAPLSAFFGLLRKGLVGALRGGRPAGPRVPRRKSRECALTKRALGREDDC